MGLLSDLSIVPQGEHEHWCWASVTAGVCQFLEKRPYSLENVVVKVLDDTTCGDQPTPLLCDIGWPLDQALSKVGHLKQPLNRTMTFQELQNEIDTLQKPVAIEIIFQSAFGELPHACLIKGCVEADGTEEVVLLDPSKAINGESQLSVSDLLSGATLGAPWTNSYVTK
jgi:hypothetical protein